MAVLHIATYNRHLGMQLSTYAEVLVILAQNFLIIALIWKVDRSVAFVEKCAWLLFITAYMWFCFSEWPTTEIRQLQLSSNIVSAFFNGFNQSYITYCNKSTGQLSLITRALSYAGIVGRTATIFNETSDFLSIFKQV